MSELAEAGAVITAAQFNTPTPPDSLVIFVDDGTFDPASYPDARQFEIEVIGAGGAGGGAAANPPASSHSKGAGGGSGGRIRGVIPASLITSPVTVTVGAAGVGATAATGGSGGDSKFSNDLVAGGGSGGASNPNSNVSYGFNGGHGGGCTIGGDWADYCVGDFGETGGLAFAGGAGILSAGGNGGGNGGGRGVNTSSSGQSNAGESGGSPGAGGGGSATSMGTVAAQPGGNGYRGEVRIWVRY